MKWLASRWLIADGCTVVGTEVLCPIGRFRLDAAGYRDSATPSERARRREGATHTPITVVVECKQSRADFLSDNAQTERLLRKRAHLERCRSELEQTVVRASEPHLRRSGTALFAELESWDFEASRTPSYRRVTAKLETLDEQLHGSTKFSTIARYRLADRMYVFSPRGLVTPAELPAGWGLLEVEEGALREASRELGRGTVRRTRAVLLEGRGDWWLGFRVRTAAPAADARPERRARLLRNIASANTRRIYGARGQTQMELFGGAAAEAPPLANEREARFTM